MAQLHTGVEAFFLQAHHRVDEVEPLAVAADGVVHEHLLRPLEGQDKGHQRDDQHGLLGVAGDGAEEGAQAAGRLGGGGGRVGVDGVEHDRYPAASSMPVALAMIFSWSAAPISRVPLERPSHITRTRSLIPSTSPSSEEIMMMAKPLSASWFMSL